MGRKATEKINEPETKDDKKTKLAQDDAHVEPDTFWVKLKFAMLYLILYLSGIFTLLMIIADSFAMSTYFSDNSLLPGLANREFSLVTEAEYYLKALEKFSNTQKRPENDIDQLPSLATLPHATNFIKNELDNFGLEVHEQSFSYTSPSGRQYNGTNIYSIIRGERSTSSESIALCVPFIKDANKNTISGVALSLALAKYFSGKSYWAKDVIVLFVDRENYGLSAWLDSYYDVGFRNDAKRGGPSNSGIYYDSLTERSGPLQAALVVDLMGKQFSRINIKLQGMYGQLPNLDLFNLIVELASRESVTPYFHDKSLPYGFQSEMELYQHNLETAISFIKNQATMQADGLHGHFLKYSIQSLTIEGPEHKGPNRDVLLASLLNVGRLVEGVFRSLNNLTERFNRSFYFYIIVSLRRFTSIGYYMIGFGLMVAPVLMKAYRLHQKQTKAKRNFIGIRGSILLASALILSLISTINISTALIASIGAVPILLIL